MVSRIKPWDKTYGPYIYIWKWPGPRGHGLLKPRKWVELGRRTMREEGRPGRYDGVEGGDPWPAQDSGLRRSAVGRRPVWNLRPEAPFVPRRWPLGQEGGGGEGPRRRQEFSQGRSFQGLYFFFFNFPFFFKLLSTQAFGIKVDRYGFYKFYGNGCMLGRLILFWSSYWKLRN